MAKFIVERKKIVTEYVEIEVNAGLFDHSVGAIAYANQGKGIVLSKASCILGSIIVSPAKVTK